MSKMRMRDRNKVRREQRQLEALERQAAYDVLTIEEKLAKLGNLPARKQRLKLIQPTMPMVKTPEEAATILAAGGGVGIDLTTKEKKGAKARKQAKKDRKGRE